MNSPNENLCEGFFKNEDQTNFENAGFDEIAEIHEIQDNDRLEIFKQFCQILEANHDNPFAVIFGPKGQASSATIESLCDFLKMPYISTTWRKQDGKKFAHRFNVYPDAGLLAKGYASVIKSLKWQEFVIIYQNEDNLIQLQDVMKLLQFQHDSKEEGVWLRQLSPDGDYRPMLKEVKNATLTPIILACDKELIPDVIRQAADVKLLSGISTNLFITSLDAHTIPVENYREYGIKKVANVTTVRLFDPYDYNFQRLVREYLPGDIKATDVLVETAIARDALTLWEKAFSSAQDDYVSNSYNHKANFKPKPKTCSDGPHFDDLGVLQYLDQPVEEGEALTGAFELKDGIRNKFKLEIVEIVEVGQMEKLKPIGIWDSITDEVQLMRNATESEIKLQQRIQNSTYTVAYKIVEPYFIEDPESPIKIKGYGVDLLKAIADIFPMTFKWEEKKLTEEILVALEKREADLGVCDLTITTERNQRIDFSNPFMSLGIGILHKKSNVSEIDNLYAFMGPFSPYVWFYTLTLFVIMSIIILLIARSDPDDWENPHPCDQNPEELENIWNIRNCFWLTMGSFMTQGCDILPKGVCSRIATAMWWFFSLIMTSTYTANLAAFLTERRKDDSIKSVEDLASQNKITYGLMKNGATQKFFESSNNSLYQRMWGQMQKESPSVFEEGNDKGRDRVLNNKYGLYAFFMESPQIEYDMARHCELRKIGTRLLDSKNFGIGMPFNAVYRNQINQAILNLSESGILSAMKEHWWRGTLESQCPSDNLEPSDALNLENVGGIFVVLGTGIGLAFLFAFIEFLWNIRRISVDEHISFWEAFKVEIKFACNITVTRKRAKPIISEKSSLSSGSSGTTGIPRRIFAGAGSVLNINTNILSRIGSNINLRGGSRDDSL